ncbi:SDR family NAD(P)-dependent oxidoreductase [Cryptosporangium sp. NPDC051539]|uniref:SDR family NAD(P)-dependent oxidoreductase n=1 Tax=Cryptosporangium sp. NPDC051539 TaxID=3363962 RepID=UPI0037A1106C
MSRIFVSGSADGLGLLAARALAAQGHRVTLHARTESRADDARKALPEADAVVVGDVSSIAATRDVAAQVNALGRHDAVIHNVAVGYQEPRRIETVDGLSHLFAVNVLAPYLLTALITRPDRLVYLSSGMHRGGRADLHDPQWTERRWNGSRAYSESKLYDLMLARAVARRWPGVPSNAVDPGWVPTRMGGPGAPDDLTEGAATQAGLAVTDDETTGRYFYHRTPHPALATTEDSEDALLAYCADLTGAAFPGGR